LGCGGSGPAPRLYENAVITVVTIIVIDDRRRRIGGFELAVATLVGISNGDRVTDRGARLRYSEAV